jgi:hypothetical protein
MDHRAGPDLRRLGPRRLDRSAPAQLHRKRIFDPQGRKLEKVAIPAVEEMYAVLEKERGEVSVRNQVAANRSLGHGAVR